MTVNELIKQLETIASYGNGDKEVVVMDPMRSQYYFSGALPARPLTTIESTRYVTFCESSTAVELCP